MIHVITDVVGDLQDGARTWSGVRIMVDDRGRVAMFTGKRAPTVYEPNTVTYTVTRSKPCACKGDAPKITLQRIWSKSEAVSV